MRNYSLKTKVNFRRNSRARGLLYLGILTASLLLVVSFFGSLLSHATALVTMPFYAARTWLAESTAPLPLYVQGRNELIEEINALKLEAATESGREATITYLSDENERLTALLEDVKEGDEPIVASVIAQPPRVPYDVLVLDKGSAVGIREGAPVMQGRDSIVGVVAHVYEQGSIVELFSSPRMRATGFVVGPDVYALVTGMGGGVMRVSVPQGVPLDSESIVVLPQLRGGIFGSVTHVESEPTEPEQYGYITLPTPLQSLRFVRVGREPLSRITYEEAEALRPVWVADFLEIPDVPPDALYGDISSTSDPVTDVVELE